MAKLLIVDDDPAVLDVLFRALSTAGHDVIRADSGAAALAASERGTVDLALLDQKMPGLTGLETFRALRARLPTLPGIIITGYGTVEIRISPR